MSFDRAPTVREILAAQRVLEPHALRTPLRVSSAFGSRYDCLPFLKLENWQPTGSFKVRGAMNFLSQLSPDEIERGLVTASAGNHALAVGFAAERLGIEGVTVFLPHTAPAAKVEKLRRFPIEVRSVGETYDDAHAAAEEFHRERGATFIHAYDDFRTVAGAGTIGLEILEQLPQVDAILVPVGGGGMISGTAIAAKSLAPDVRVYGVQPEASPALRDSLRDGVVYEQYAAGPTICDGLAGGIGQIVYKVAQDYIDDVLVVSEENVRRAVASFLSDEQMVVEGSGAVGLAALMQRPRELTGKRVALVVSGGNIDASRLVEIEREHGLDRG